MIKDTEGQADVEKALTFLSLVHNRYIVTSASCLTQPETPSHPKAFPLAQCHALPSTVLDGKYKRVPLAEGFAPVIL